MPELPADVVHVPDEWLLAAAIEAHNDGRDRLADFDGDDLGFLSDGLAAVIPLIRAAERARIAADLEARAKAIEDTHGENGDWLAEQFATHLPSLPIGGAVQDDPRSIAVEAYRGIAFIVSAPADACPQAAPESTQSPETTSVAPVYRSRVERPAETHSALREQIARAIARRAGSQAFDHTDRAWDDLRNRWLSYADAALAVLDGAGAVPEHTAPATTTEGDRR